MDWITGALTVVAMELVARRRWEGWALALATQGFWLWLVWSNSLWGLLPLTVILSWRYSVALVRWRGQAGS